MYIGQPLFHGCHPCQVTFLSCLDHCRQSSDLSLCFYSYLLTIYSLHNKPEWFLLKQSSQQVILLRSLLKLMSIEPVMPSNHLMLCHPLLLLSLIFPSIRIFSNVPQATLRAANRKGRRRRTVTLVRKEDSLSLVPGHSSVGTRVIAYSSYSGTWLPTHNREGALKSTEDWLPPPEILD